MKKKILTICLILVLTVTSVGLTAANSTASIRSVDSLSMFKASKWTDHLRTPNIDQIETILQEEGVPLGNPEAAVQKFQKLWAERNPTTPNPKKLQDLLDREAKGLPGPMAATGKTEAPQIMSLAVPVEFPGTDTFIYSSTDPDTGACVDLETTQIGPLHNEIAPPGPRDNNTIWYEDASPALYNELYFGVGPRAGVVVNHPNLGRVDLRGSTMANYYLEQSEGAFTPKGLIYPKWLQASRSEGWYGQNSCATGSRYLHAQDLVAEVVDAVIADNPSFAWQTYDGDGDGIVDNFTVIHAGQGEEGGGGVQGTFAIWSHASAIEWPTGKLACTMGSAGCPDRDIFVREYSMDPENIDVGVIAEEFGHAAFGLPDIYTTDAQGSPSNWVIFEAGSWNGKIGGMTPAPFPLFFRYLVGWANPVTLDYTTAVKQVKVGQLSLRPKGTEQGVRINLPPATINVPNPLDTGKAWWSQLGNYLDNTLTHSLDLTGTTAPIFSFASYWSLEEDWDYGYIEVSEDDGATWTILQDMDAIFVDTNPNGNNQGWGLTGEGTGTLRADLTAYAGKTILVRLHYSTDAAVQWDGWWADDFALTDGATALWSDDIEGALDSWTADGWAIVPLSQSYVQYYLAEWRNLSGFDKGLATPYTTIYSDETTNEWEVDRCPYTVPGMLLWLRNASQSFDYTLYNSINDSPSIGPKHALLVVDSHYWPMEWDTVQYTTGAGYRLNSRCQPGNSTFTVQKTTPFTARLGDGLGGVLETKTFEPLPAVSQFHDSLGYYPGFYYPGSGAYVYYWDKAASVVVPAMGDYSTRITNLDKTPDLADYGFGFGSGDPRDDGVQYGVNIAVLAKAPNGSWGKIAVWNAKSLGSLDLKVNKAKALPGMFVGYQIKIKNISPAMQTYTVIDPIPANTKYLKGKNYDAASNSIKWTGKLSPNQTKVLTFWVRVDKTVPFDTVITNLASLMDDASGATASATTIVGLK